MRSGPSARVLLVEDNPADAELVELALADAGYRVSLITISNGWDAIDFVRRQGRWEQAPPVDLVLLDLNLPGLHGDRVLATIKADQELRAIPTIVVSSCVRKHLVEAADGVIPKAPLYPEFLESVETTLRPFLGGPDGDGRTTTDAAQPR